MDLSIITSILSALPGIGSLAWLLYGKFIAKPKIVIDLEDVTPRLTYTPQSWAWFSSYEQITWCRPYGAVISIAVRNKGKAPATQCKAKMRFGLSTLEEGKHTQGDWSKFFELHWSENPENDVDRAYETITIGKGETTYVDLLLYHTRLTTHPSIREGRLPIEDMMEYGNPEIGTILSFYTKPLIRGELPNKPCGWNPPTEFLKLPTISSHDINRGLIHYYEVEIYIICDNAQSKARLYLILLRDSDSLAIYAFSSLNDLKEILKRKAITAQPVYIYRKQGANDPNP